MNGEWFIHIRVHQSPTGVLSINTDNMSDSKRYDLVQYINGDSSVSKDLFIVVDSRKKQDLENDDYFTLISPVMRGEFVQWHTIYRYKSSLKFRGKINAELIEDKYFINLRKVLSYCSIITPLLEEDSSFNISKHTFDILLNQTDSASYFIRRPKKDGGVLKFLDSDKMFIHNLYHSENTNSFYLNVKNYSPLKEKDENLIVRAGKIWLNVKGDLSLKAKVEKDLLDSFNSKNKSIIGLEIPKSDAVWIKKEIDFLTHKSYEYEIEVL